MVIITYLVSMHTKILNCQKLLENSTQTLLGASIWENDTFAFQVNLKYFSNQFDNVTVCICVLLYIAWKSLKYL